MRVDPGGQRLLLDLADTDAEVSRLEHRGRTLPEDAQIADLTAKLESARDDLVRADIAAEDLAREYGKIDSEVSGMSAREARDSALLTAGGLAPKALSELQHELNSLGRRRTMLEDELLSVMEQQEAVGGERDRAAATIDHLEKELAEVRVRRDEAVGAIGADMARATERRTRLAAEIDPALAAVYDRQRAAGHVGAGLLRARRCGACRMELDRGTIAGIAAAPADEVIRCEECGAILVRTAESGL